MTQKVHFFRRGWFLVLVAGIALFLVTDLAMTSTGNPNYLPTLLLIGAFLVPITFVAYIFQKVPPGEIPLQPVAITFLWGGALGSVVAGVLEFQAARTLGILPMTFVGLIEEAAKLILPVAIFLQGRYRHEADGLLFGVAAGMGFAALETMGYGLLSFIQSRGDVNILHQTLLFRGLFSPAGHAAWTGIICAALWRQRAKVGHAVINGAVIGTFFLAVFLHALWDILGSASSALGPNFAFVDFIGILIIGGISLWLLLRRLVVAHHTPVKIASGDATTS